MAKNNKNTYSKRKSMGLRIFILSVAAALLLGIIIMPFAVRAEENPENLVVHSFETGRLDEAMLEAADGTDYNFIKNMAVLSGTLDEADYAALTAIPNLEILELAGTETKDGVIPENALPSRNQLSVLTLPKNTVEIGGGAFSGNRKLVKVYMPATVLKIGDRAFSACESLENIPVSEAVTYIGEGAFQDCKAIKEFVIPAGITEIYPDTFSKCGFEKISIGPNVKKIGAGVFADCNELKDIYAYGGEAPALGSDVFRNVGATVHCYENSEESYKSWVQNNIKTAGDLTGEYSLKAEIPADNSSEYTETEAGTAAEEYAGEVTENIPAESAEPAAEAAVSAPADSGRLSVGVVIVIVIMAMIIAVLATVLVMTRKKKE